MDDLYERDLSERLCNLSSFGNGKCQEESHRLGNISNERTKKLKAKNEIHVGSKDEDVHFNFIPPVRSVSNVPFRESPSYHSGNSQGHGKFLSLTTQLHSNPTKQDKDKNQSDDGSIPIVSDEDSENNGLACGQRTPLIQHNLNEFDAPAALLSKSSKGDERLKRKTLNRSDSLPHHRERLSLKRRRLHANKRCSISDEAGESNPVFAHAGNCSTSSLLSNNEESSILPDFAPGETTSSADLVDRHCQESECNCKRSENMSVMDQIEQPIRRHRGSWLENQSFDYIDSSYANLLLSTQSNSSYLSPGHSPYVRREEISFGAPTPRDVTFNVSGQYYRIDPDVLARFPDTMLGNREKRAKYWDSKRNEYFLDRHKATFEVVIDYYMKNGILSRPDDIPIDIFIHEIKFYSLDRENIVNFLSAEGILLVAKEKPMPNSELKKFIWNLFEEPESCVVARIVTTMSAIVIAISVVVFCMETVPSFESLGKKSIDNIEPALKNCQSLFYNHPEYFQPNGSLFAPMIFNESSSIMKPYNNKRNRDLRSTTKERIKSNDSNSDDHSSESGERGKYDNFDSGVILSTMKQTLIMCSQDPSISLLSKYTYLRCKEELIETYEYRKETIHNILSKIEVHDDHDVTKNGSAKTNNSALNDCGYSSKNASGEDCTIKNSTIRKIHENGRKKQRNSRRKHRGRDHVNTTQPCHHKRNRHDRPTKNNTLNLMSSNIKNAHGEKLQIPLKKKLMTLEETMRGLHQLCMVLDNTSIRSSYHWLAVEAFIGGTAGILFLIESGCIVWFVIEILLRLFSCPNKKKFCLNFLNIIDAIAIMPYFITLIVNSLHTHKKMRPQTATILRTIRLVRMLRILKLSRHSRGLRILGLTLLRSTRVLVLLVCFQMVLAVTFSSIVYYVEYDAKDTKFKSIPGSFWWAIITMTTVGYGDVVPITTAGKITGTFCAIMGILGIAFPVPVIVSNFNYLYNLDSDACKLTPEELMGDDDSENDSNNNVEKFQENLFHAVRRNVGSMTSGPQEQPTGQNPAELWNYTRRQYHSGDKKRNSKISDPAPKHKYSNE